MNKETGIIFTPFNVDKVNRDLKTQTRRPMRKQPHRNSSDYDMDAEAGDVVIYKGWPHILKNSTGRNKMDSGILTPVRIKCPYGEPGDLLYVKERWRRFNAVEECSHYELCNCFKAHNEPIYYADNFDDDSKWKPALFMPKILARLWLKITSVNWERIQKITEDDAKAEGAEKQFIIDAGIFIRNKNIDFENVSTHRNGFIISWNNLYEKEPGKRFEANPYVWKIEFKRIKK